ncbi:hypothetical protein CDD80_1305 [Ophiocordyceps camponoti-rufipedis]|uniref:NADH-ubiquinone oxidoreductase B12 subunit n=1 Tax=Ophiocordyceps camponoti-rufipedis TaxID=2004952 RepID=A0A2C5YF55_9HYPO|nr:hypothetical protein CDD80_1305 [Ophiocordyceps camponoti-rufipedis]
MSSKTQRETGSSLFCCDSTVVVCGIALFQILLAARQTKPNITGFDIRALRAATGVPKYDPWERAEAWRYQGTFTRWNRFKNATPGLGIATVAFTIYCVYEHYFLESEHHDQSHAEEGHH